MYLLDYACDTRNIPASFSENYPFIKLSIINFQQLPSSFIFLNNHFEALPDNLV